MKVEFSELALAGLRRLIPEEWRRISIEKHIALMLRFDPTLNAYRYRDFDIEGFWIRGFYAGVELRVLFELDEGVSVWSIGRASAG